MQRSRSKACESTKGLAEIIEYGGDGCAYIKMGGLIQFFRENASYVVVEAMIHHLQRDGSLTKEPTALASSIRM